MGVLGELRSPNTPYLPYRRGDSHRTKSRTYVIVKSIHSSITNPPQIGYNQAEIQGTA